MEGKATKKEKFHYYNSLACVVKSLEGKYIIVDLRNESSVTGKIKEVDGFWNIQMEDAVFYTPKGDEYAFETFFIAGRNIRFVHVPENLQIADLIQEQLMPKKIKKKEANTYKKKRAQKYNEETIKEAFLKT